MAKKKILVVDNDADARESIKLQLEHKGLHVLEAEDGENAIDILRSSDNLVNVGVILSDVQMPKVNGVECIQFLIEQVPEIPIVAITGFLFMNGNFEINQESIDKTIQSMPQEIQDAPNTAKDFLTLSFVGFIAASKYSLRIGVGFSSIPEESIRTSCLT